MSAGPEQEPLYAIPAEAPFAPRQRNRSGAGGCFLTLFLVGSILLNCFFLVILLIVWGTSSLGSSDGRFHERHYSGSKTANDKIAIVQLKGVLIDELNGYMEKQIERAAEDSLVKAVVLRVNSPGGTITASDELHRRITELRDGNPEKRHAAKPIIVSMGSIAASGGYYLAMPAKTLVAERTTITGSIGVYASLPNITKLGEKVGFSMNIIRAGDVKDSGSMFHDMTPHERELWQAMIDHSYLQFLDVVEKGRPVLKGKMQEDIVVDQTVPIRDEEHRSKHVKYTRYRADGGIFMADEALKYGLIDEIGTLDDAIKILRKQASLAAEIQVVMYERPLSLFGALTGAESTAGEARLDWEHLANGLTPRLWYLSSQSELAGVVAACKQR
jgi:protease-4